MEATTKITRVVAALRVGAFRGACRIDTTFADGRKDSREVRADNLIDAIREAAIVGGSWRLYCEQTVAVWTPDEPVVGKLPGAHRLD